MKPAVATICALPLAAISSCGPATPVDPTIFELANIHPANIVPKTSPAALIKAFDEFCVERIDAPDTIPAALIAVDYVAVPGPGGGRPDVFVVDDRRPLVMLMPGPDTDGCAVAAEPRTGQSQRVRTYMATRFPEAVPVDPARVGPTAEAAWHLRDRQAVIFVLREGAPSTPGRIVLGITQ